MQEINVEVRIYYSYVQIFCVECFQFTLCNNTFFRLDSGIDAYNICMFEPY